MIFVFYVIAYFTFARRYICGAHKGRERWYMLSKKKWRSVKSVYQWHGVRFHAKIIADLFQACSFTLSFHSDAINFVVRLCVLHENIDIDELISNARKQMMHDVEWDVSMDGFCAWIARGAPTSHIIIIYVMNIKWFSVHCSRNRNRNRHWR